MSAVLPMKPEITDNSHLTRRNTMNRTDSKGRTARQRWTYEWRRVRMGRTAPCHQVAEACRRMPQALSARGPYKSGCYGHELRLIIRLTAGWYVRLCEAPRSSKWDPKVSAFRNARERKAQHDRWTSEGMFRLPG